MPALENLDAYLKFITESHSDRQRTSASRSASSTSSTGTVSAAGNVSSAAAHTSQSVPHGDEPRNSCTMQCASQPAEVTRQLDEEMVTGSPDDNTSPPNAEKGAVASLRRAAEGNKIAVSTTSSPASQTSDMSRAAAAKTVEASGAVKVSSVNLFDGNSPSAKRSLPSQYRQDLLPSCMKGKYRV